MKHDRLTRAWLELVALTAISTIVAVILPRLDATQTKIAGAVILVVAWSKARLILGRYLDLHEAPRVWRGFDFALGVVMLAFLGLFLSASGVVPAP